ncbi:hypothetical protein ANO11243_021200 [Dothideomycetidae sp. 11243]|nr:hypothetical protein ANO11243_021200 [fungal sp. No.11243]
MGRRGRTESDSNDAQVPRRRWLWQSGIVASGEDLGGRRQKPKRMRGRVDAGWGSPRKKEGRRGSGQRAERASGELSLRDNDTKPTSWRPETGTDNGAQPSGRCRSVACDAFASASAGKKGNITSGQGYIGINALEKHWRQRCGQRGSVPVTLSLYLLPCCPFLLAPCVPSLVLH